MSSTTDPAPRPTLRAGDRITLSTGAEARTGTITGTQGACVRFVDDTTGRTSLVDPAHWDSLALDTIWPSQRAAATDWLRDAIAGDPSVLGLGELRHAPHGRRGGSHDLLLDDPAVGTRFSIDAQHGPCTQEQLSRGEAAARREQHENPHTLVVPVVVAEQFRRGIRPAVGIAIEARALDTGHGLHLEFTVLEEEEAPCPLGGAA
jgi:hypothetical protein